MIADYLVSPETQFVLKHWGRIVLIYIAAAVLIWLMARRGW